MRRAVRAIVIKDGHLLVMHRNKFGKEYETLPGGNIEIGESTEQALLRELSEETSVEVEVQQLVFIEHAGDPYGSQYVYLCKYVSGEPQLAPDSEEALINKLGQNLYDPKWVSLEELPNLPFLSEKLKQSIVEAAATEFPAEAIEFTSA